MQRKKWYPKTAKKNNDIFSVKYKKLNKSWDLIAWLNWPINH